jgi:hypothetical protein
MLITASCAALSRAGAAARHPIIMQTDNTAGMIVSVFMRWFQRFDSFGVFERERPISFCAPTAGKANKYNTPFRFRGLAHEQNLCGGKRSNGRVLNTFWAQKTTEVRRS